MTGIEYLSRNRGSKLERYEEESIMSRVKVVSMLSAALIATAASLPSLAGGKYHHHGHGHGSVSFGFVFGGPWYYPGYYYPPYYYPVPVRTEPTVYIERGDAGAPAEQSRGSQGYWYYCKESKAYHPYVKHCPGGWEKQVPAPAPGG
jgi:hypothetical protein